MKKIFVLCNSILLLAAGCSKSPEQARKDLSAMGVPFDESSFQTISINCDMIAIDNFLKAGMAPDRGLVGATQGSCLEAVKLLAKDTDNSDILSEALYESIRPDPSEEQNEIVQILLNNGADPNAGVENRQSALQLAARYNNTEALDLLLKKGAEVNADDTGSPALVAAVNSNSLEATEMLLSKGADPNSRVASDQECSTVLSVAMSKDFTDIASLLINKQATLGGRECECNYMAEVVNDSQDFMQDFELQIRGFSQKAKRVKSLPDIKAAANQFIDAVDQAVLGLEGLDDTLKEIPLTDGKLKAFAGEFSEVSLAFASALQQTSAAMSILSEVESESQLPSTLESSQKQFVEAVASIQDLSEQETQLINNVNEYCGVE